MQWVMFLIVLATDQYIVKPMGTFPTMADCFAKRDELVEQINRPIIDYQVVCVAKSEGKKIVM